MKRNQTVHVALVVRVPEIVALLEKARTPIPLRTVPMDGTVSLLPPLFLIFDSSYLSFFAHCHHEVLKVENALSHDTFKVPC